MKTRFRAPARGARVILGVRRPGLDPSVPGGELGQRALELLAGPQVAGLRQVEAGSAALRQRYLLWAESAAELDALLTPELEAALLGWNGPNPVIRRDGEGLEIELAGAHLKDARARGARRGVPRRGRTRRAGPPRPRAARIGAPKRTKRECCK
jgi:hypothetical protein